jgi:hypothetical protein
MYLATSVHITFPATRDREEMKFISCNSFRVESSWQTLTDTCEFIISQKLFFKQETRIFEKIKTGDPFYLEAGYNGNYEKEFTGYVSEILDDLPVVFKGEDNMYKLKRTRVNKSYKSVKLSKLLRDIVPSQFNVDTADIQLGDFLFKNYTVAQVLTELKDNYGIYSYFVDNTLYSGRIYQDNPRTEVVRYDFGKKNFIENDLKYRHKNDFQLKVTMRSHLKNGKVLKETVGDPEGQEQKLVCSNITDRDQIKKLAQKELERLQYDGYRGTITGFGIPMVRHGYTVIITNPNNPNKNGNFYVDSVTTTFNDKGAIRRVCKLGKKAAVQ